MKCVICDTETKKGIGGPGKLFVCLECVEDLSVAEEKEIEGKCSFCGTDIGTVKGFFRSRKIQAVAVNPNNGTILCSECGKLCRDIVKYQVEA
jgi:hypothetical protein